jgi:hypothetical protein
MKKIDDSEKARIKFVKEVIRRVSELRKESSLPRRDTAEKREKRAMISDK